MNSNKGFGLVGLLITVLLIAILSGGVFYGYKGGLFGGGTASSTITGPIDAAKKAKDLLEKQNQKVANEVSNSTSTGDKKQLSKDSKSNCYYVKSQSEIDYLEKVRASGAFPPSYTDTLKIYWSDGNMTVLVSDALGKHTGINQNHDIFEDIPESSTEEIGGTREISLLADTDHAYQLEILASTTLRRAYSNYLEFLIIFPDGSEGEKIVYYLPLIAGMRAVVQIKCPSDVGGLPFDINGDKVPDFLAVPGEDFKINSFNLLKAIIKNDAVNIQTRESLEKNLAEAISTWRSGDVGKSSIALRDIQEIVISLTKTKQIDDNLGLNINDIAGFIKGDYITENQGPECDINGDSKVNQMDIDMIYAARGAEKVPTTDPRDVNRDGKITELDSNYCASKCKGQVCTVL